MAADELLRFLIQTLEDLGVPYAIGGSVASIGYGEPRATMDIDVVVRLNEETVTKLIARFPTDEFYVDAAAAAEAVSSRTQFNVIHPSSGFKVDVFIEGDAIETAQIERRQRLLVLPGLTATLSPPEELIVKKLQYFRMGGSDKHLRDVAAMLKISPGQIDTSRVRTLATDAGLLSLWEEVAKRASE